MVFDDSQRFKCLSEPHAVSNDATAKSIQLVDGANNAIPLKLVEFLPDNCIADSSCSIDNFVLVELVFPAAEEAMKSEDVDEIGVAVTRQLLQRAE